MGEKRLDLMCRYIRVDFNAWEYSGSELLWASLIQKLYGAVENQLTEDVVRQHRLDIATSGEKLDDLKEVKKRKNLWNRQT